MKRSTLWIAAPFVLLAACDGAPATDPVSPESAAVVASRGGNSARVDRGEFDFSFGPVPVSAPCLGSAIDGELSIGGTWGVRLQRVITPTGRVHWNEWLDYSRVLVWSGELEWLPGPGAHEKIQWLGDAGGPRNVVHEFHARYLSQDGRPDLLVSHRIHRVWGPDGTLRRDEGVPPTFSATCLGGGG